MNNGKGQRTLSDERYFLALNFNFPDLTDKGQGQELDILTCLFSFYSNVLMYSKRMQGNKTTWISFLDAIASLHLIMSVSHPHFI